MIDYNACCEKAESVIQFWSFTQNWFDILSLVLTVLSLWFAYYLGKSGFEREKKHEAKEKAKLVKSEINLFKNNLKQLNEAIKKQLVALNNYKDQNNFNLEFNPEVQVDFLKFIQVKNIYEHIGFDNQLSLDKINDLFAALFSLNDFRHSLRDSLRSYIARYSEFEKGFYLYRKLMYKMMHEIANRRSIDMIPDVVGIHIDFGNNQFAKEFFHLNQSSLSNPEMSDKDGNLIRAKLIEIFVLPSIELSKLYIPADKDAIEVADIANEVHSSWINMEQVTINHFNEIDSHIETLENVEKEINEFLTLEIK